MLTRDEQALAYAFGGWQIVDVLCGHTDRIPEYGGRSHSGIGEPGDWLEYNRTRIVVGPCGSFRDPKKARIQITWAAIAKHGQTLDSDLQARLHANNREATRWAVCGHNGPSYGTRDIVRRWYVDAWKSGWHEWSRRIRDDRDALLAEAFPLAVDNEPTDLLELLAAIA